MPYPFIIQGNNITVVIGNKPHTISRSHITYQKVIDAIKAGEWTKVADLVEPKKVVLNYGKGNVSVQGETLFWKGKPMHNALTNRMVAMLQDEFPVEPLVNFMENLMTNPSKRAVDELYGFLEKNSLPITPDGHFLAYKKVRADYLDIYSGTMDNSVGKVLEMERNEVNDDKDQTCSAGLHFCSQEYLPHFGTAEGTRVVIVKINPRDVVSIPSDYNNAKGRTCRYEVIGEIDGDKVDAAFTQSVQSTTATARVANGPKTGTSDFYNGYSDGYNGNAYTGSGKNYAEGYDKGMQAYRNGEAAAYVFVPPAVTVPVQPATASGKQLSMTPNAIRKRAARAAKRTQTTVNNQVAWPLPTKK